MTRAKWLLNAAMVGVVGLCLVPTQPVLAQEQSQPDYASGCREPDEEDKEIIA